MPGLRPPTSRFLATITFLCLAASLIASSARAEEVFLAVEESASPTERLPILVRADRAGPVDLAAWRIGNPGALLDAGVPLEDGRAIAWLDPADRVADRHARQARLRRDGAFEPIPLDVSAMRVEANKARAFGVPLGAPGLYFLRVRSGRQAAYATALVTDLGLVVKRDADGMLVWAVDRKTGEPVAEAEIHVRAGGREVTAGETDADGLARFALVLPPTVEVRAHYEAHWAFGESTWYPAGSSDRRVHLSTHQPAYRPGERVEVRGIVRAVQDGRYRLEPSVRSASVRLIGPDGSEVDRKDAPVSADMGTLAIAFDLAEDAQTGDWRVTAEIAGRTYDAPLVVAAYRKPAFEVVVRPSAPRALVGTDATFDVRASYYDGGRLPTAPVQWELAYHRVDRQLFPEDEMVRLFFGTEREAYRPETLASGEGVLDADGGLQVPVSVPTDRADGWLTLRATVTGPDRMAVVGSGRISVSAAPVAAALQTDRHLYGPEDTVQVSIRVENADGSPAAGREGVLTVGLAPEAGGEVPREDWLHTLVFRTADDGTATVEVSLAGAGRYALAVSVPRLAEEPPGPPAHAGLHVWAVGDRKTPGHGGTSLEVIADRAHYAVGERARLLAVPPGRARPILATLEGDGLLASRVIRPEAGSPTWDLVIDEAHVPNVFASFAAVEEGNLATASHTLRIPPITRLLGTEVAPDEAELEPGTTSGLTVAVTDADGRPVAGAEVSVAVVDEALFALHRDPGAPLEAFFHPPRRNGVGTEGVLHWRSVGFARIQPPPATEDAAGLSAPAASPAMPAPAEAGPPEPEPSGACGGAAGDSCGGGGAAGEEPALADEETADDGDGAFGRVFGARGEEEAEERLHLEQVGKAQGGGTEAAERQDFRSAVYWAPALRTGEDGRVRIEDVTYGDSLTRWRLTARAIDAATRVGTGTASVRTRKQVSVDVTLPRFLRATDRAEVVTVVRNLTDQALEARWRASWDVTDAAPGGGGGGAGVHPHPTLAPHGAWVHRFPVEVTSPGTLTVNSRVTTDIASDAVSRTIPVHPQGIGKVEGHTLFTEAGEANLELTIPAHAERGTIDLRVSVEPAFAQAMLAALPYLEDYPHGCTEQTMNRFVPLLAAAEAVAALGAPPSSFGAAELDEMIEAGVKRLGQLQHGDGGFGWWETDESHPGMTALVARGLARLLRLRPDDARAREIQQGAAARLKAWVDGNGIEDPAVLASALLGLARAGQLDPAVLSTPSVAALGDDGPLVARALLLRT
ncbi:MAG: MG2 domain-containing protein, partial [Planctomycetota bacterium]